MANTKISDLPAASTLGASDFLPVVQNGTTKKLPASQLLLTPRAVTASATAAPGEFLVADATAGAVTITAPAAGASRRWGAKKSDSTTNVVSISYLNAAGTAATITLAVQDDAKTFEPLGSGYVAVAADRSRTADDKRYLVVDANGRLATSRSTNKRLLGVPVASLNSIPVSSQVVAGGNTVFTSRMIFQAVQAATDLAPVVVGWYQDQDGEHIAANPITYNMTLEVGGASYPITWNGGASTVTVGPGGMAQADPLGVELAAGDVFYIRTSTTVASTTAKYVNSIYSGGGPAYSSRIGGGYTLGSDATAGTGVLATAGEYQQSGPVVVLGLPLGPRLPVIGGGIDSITMGYQDTRPGGDGWFNRGLNGAFPAMLFAVTGLPIAKVASKYGHLRQSVFLELLTDFVCLAGTNDFSGGGGQHGTVRTSAQVISDLTNWWAFLAARGIRVWAATLPPLTTSTDSWATTANQTVSANEAARVAINTFIRTAPAPLSGVFETADTVETARNSGLWKVTGSANGYTADGIHPTATGATTMGAAIVTAGFVV